MSKLSISNVEHRDPPLTFYHNTTGDGNKVGVGIWYRLTFKINVSNYTFTLNLVKCNTIC